MPRSCWCCMRSRKLSRIASGCFSKSFASLISSSSPRMWKRSFSGRRAASGGGFLQVRLERVGRVLVLGVALLLLELLRLEESRRIGSGAERLLELPVESAAARKVARLEQRGAHRHVFGSGLDAALDGAHA